MKQAILKLYCSIILISSDENKIDSIDKAYFWYKSILASFLASLALSPLGLWFSSNSQFVQWVFGCIVVNAILGGIMHKKQGTFSWKILFKSTLTMLFYIVAVYYLLEALRSPLGDSAISVEFKRIIQIATLIWPVSKSLKTVHILTDKKHPPHSVMRRLYNFEKTGNEKALYDNDFKEDDKLDNVG